jgi:hypothetical protein
VAYCVWSRSSQRLPVGYATLDADKLIDVIFNELRPLLEFFPTLSLQSDFCPFRPQKLSKIKADIFFPENM